MSFSLFFPLPCSSRQYVGREKRKTNVTKDKKITREKNVRK
jgi:hypothetical protein